MESERSGVAELRLTATPALAELVTRVTVESSQTSADLLPHAAEPDTFAGAIVLPAGPHSLIVRAFADTTQIGASNPIDVTVAAGVVTRVNARILDQRVAEGPIFGPVFDSLTAPTTVAPGAAAAFQITILAPAGDAVDYAWTSSCADAAFSTPTAAATTWSKPTVGTCTITVVARSRGYVVTKSFEIVVQDDSGTVEVSGAFVTGPTVMLSLPSYGCGNTSGSNQNASCAATPAAPERVPFRLIVPSWGQSVPGSLELVDNCGGKLEDTTSSLDAREGFWTPPVAGGLCILGARGVNSDGLHSSTALAVLTRPGVAAPVLSAQLNGCALQPGVPPLCDAAATNALIGSVVWPDAPGTLRLIDGCFGELNAFGPQFAVTWIPSAGPGQTCLVQVRATAPSGAFTEISAIYRTLFPICGNGRLEPGEQCDDGNAINGDGCESNCTFTR